MMPNNERISYNKPAISSGELPSIPVRSLLYHLAPIGVGTPFVESLTGYIQRLAVMHNVTTGTLMAKTIIPALDNQKLNDTICRGGSRIYERAYSFNGQSQATFRFVKILERLTLREGLICLTLLPWAYVLPCKTLFRKTRAWCPLCYEKWETEGPAVYEPLIWTLNPIKVCPEHFYPLVSMCRHCRQTMGVHTRNSRPGYCSKCHSWLGEHIEQFMPDYNDRWDIENLKALIAEAPGIINAPDRQTVLDGLMKHIADHYDSSPIRFARAFHIPRSGVSRWRKGAYPSLDTLLRLCRGTRTPLTALFKKGCLHPLNTNPGIVKGKEGVNPIAARFRKRIDYVEIKEQLKRILMDHRSLPYGFESPPSMQQTANAIGCSKRTLYKHFPDLCKGIAAKSKANRELRKQAREREACDAVRKICRSIDPSYGSVAKALGPKAGVLREKAVREAWKEERAILEKAGSSQ